MDSNVDPEKLNTIYSRIISSSAITRENLSRKSLIQPIIEENQMNNDEDDIHFFETLKNKIKSGHFNCLKAKYKINKMYGTRKRKHNFIEKSKDEIKHFKDIIENKNHIKVDNINFHSKEQQICINHSEFSNCNNDVLKSVNTNVDSNESYALKREFTLIFQTDNKQNQSILIKPNKI